MKTALLGIAGAGAVAAAVYAGAMVYGSRAPNPAAAPSAPACCAAGDQQRLTLNPDLFQGPVKQAYQIAEKHPALLAQMHCYCGCDRTNNHKNLLDCFRDTHGASCAICVGEAMEADKLANQGKPIEQIRDALRAHYAFKE